MLSVAYCWAHLLHWLQIPYPPASYSLLPQVTANASTCTFRHQSILVPSPIRLRAPVKCLLRGKIPGGLIELSCSGDSELTKEFRASPYGRGTEGKVVELNCGSKHRFLFLLLPASNKPSPLSCSSTESIFGRPARATAASFGHQAFCMENWEGESNPKERLLEAARKNSLGTP